MRKRGVFLEREKTKIKKVDYQREPRRENGGGGKSWREEGRGKVLVIPREGGGGVNICSPGAEGGGKGCRQKIP